MKTRMLLISALAIGVLAPTMGAMAQYHPTGQDGITASPRARKMLDEREASAQAKPDVGQPAAQSSGRAITASPKAQTLLAERRASTAVDPAVEAALPSTTRPPADGIAASPKLREQMQNRPVQNTFELAPVSR